MRVTIDVDLTPTEARIFFGMPDLEPLNKMIVDEMTAKARENLDTIADPERLVAQWMAMSGRGIESFQALVAAAMGGAGGAKK